MISRLAGLRLSCPIAARYLWDILFRSYLVEIGRPTPGCAAAGVSVQRSLAHSSRMRRTSLPPNRIGTKRKMPQAFFAWCRETGRFASFDALIKGRGRTRLCTGCTIPFCGQTSPHVCADMSAGEPAASSCLIPGSQPECLRHSRRKKSLAGQKNGRHFAAGRETGIFPAKSAFFPPMCSRQAKLPTAISTPRFGESKNPPGWPVSGFRVLSPRDIYGAFCSGPIW